MKKIIDDYCTNVIVTTDEIKDIRILYDKKMKMSQWYSKYKPDILINAALFNMSDGSPIEYFISDNKTYHTSDWCKDGFGIKKDGTIKFGTVDNTYKDFMVGFPVLIKDNKININFDIGVSLSGKQPRSLLSYNEKTKEIILTTVDGRRNNKPGKTIQETANYINQFGVTHSINMDGGGSTRMLIDGQTVNSPPEDRAVSSVIAIWLKTNEQSPTKGGSKVKVCLDYGHNNSGWDTGASYYGVREQDITYSIGKIVKKRLEEHGIEVVETRPTQTTNLGTTVNSSLKARVDIANKAKVDDFISIHTNASSNATAKGTETYIIAKGGNAEKMANAVNTNLCKEMGTVNRGVIEKNLYVLKNTDAPAILVELAFLSNQNECKLLTTKQNEFVECIVKGYCEYKGIVYKKNVTENIPISKNQYSYDDTVEQMILKGIIDIENMQCWEKVLAGTEAANKDSLRAIFNKMLEKI